MVRTRGRSERGTRLIDTSPHRGWKTSTFIAALRQDGLAAPLVCDGAINGNLLLAYVGQILVPTLRRSDTVIMDNLSLHKKATVRGSPHLVPPPLQPRSEPDRAGVRKAKVDPTCEGLTNPRRALEGAWRHH